MIELGGNRISGPVLLVNNTGHGDADQSGAGPEIEANMIGRPAVVLREHPHPTGDLLPNSVQGPATGQCAGLPR